MAMETDTYRHTLRHLHEKGSAMFPGKEMLNVKEVSDILGISRPTIYRRKDDYGFKNGYTTYPKLAKAVDSG